MRLDLAHVSTRIFDVPLLLHGGKLDTILSAVGARILDGSAANRSIDPAAIAAGLAQRDAAAGRGERRLAGGGYLAGAGIGVLPIIGSLVRRSSYLDAESGLASYATVARGFDEMLASSSVRGVMLEMDTPGGEAGGCFDLARHIRTAAAAAGKPVWAHVNELAASAGYALASAASKIWISTTGEAGSIGVFAAHIDQSFADAKAGHIWTFISAGENKVDGNAHEPLSDRARATIQADVSALYGMFVDLVAEHRPKLSAARVRATNANTFRGVLAVEAGLADHVGTFDQALEALAAHVNRDDPARPTVRHARAAALSAQVNAPQVAAATAAARERAAVIMGQAACAKRFGVELDSTALIASHTEPEEISTHVMNLLAERDEAIVTNTRIVPSPTGASGGITPEMKRAAWKKGIRGGK